MLGIRNFNEEMLMDVMKNPFGYITSLTAGLFTATKLVVTPPPSTWSGEVLKSLFAIVTAILIVVFSFIAKKLIEPIWEQKLKPKVYKILGLK